MHWQDLYQDKLINADQAAQLVTSGSQVLFPVMDQPKDIILALADRYQELADVTLTAHWVQPFPFLDPGQHPDMKNAFLVKDPMTLPFTREGIAGKWLDWQPTVFGLSNGKRQADPQRGRLYHFKDIFFFKLTVPDQDGRCSFGPYPWYTPSACRTAKIKVAQIDPQLPRVCGESIHIDEIDYLVPMPETDKAGKRENIGWEPSPEVIKISRAIGAHAASLIHDGDTLQLGVGTAAEAVMEYLGEKNDLGLDSEVIYAQMVELVKNGNISGRQKSNDRGKATSACLQLYGDDPRNDQALEYVTENPAFEFREISTQCDVKRIAAQDNMVAVNNVLSVDLLGQIVVTHLGPTPIGGPGGQVDYCIGAHYSDGGRSISMLKSTALGDKVSRIVPAFEPGTAVTIPMFYLDYLVTEHGIANLDCKSRRERAEALISVSHPDFQSELENAAMQMFYP